MSAFLATQLPTAARACNLVEFLALWTAYSLQRNNANASFLRVAGKDTEPCFTVSDFPDADNIMRRQVVLVFAIDGDALLNGAPQWKQVKEASTAVISPLITG